MIETRATSDSDRLQSRLRPVHGGALTVDTHLDHFALVTYAVPPERLRTLIPGERFDLELVSIDGRESALVSAVPFLDVGFHFRALPVPRFGFGQTNYRAYVRDKRTGEPAVWFFGTTLGSRIVAIPRALWRIPWHRARYHFQCEYDAAADRHARYEIDAESDWSPMHLALDDSGAAAGIQPGFTTLAASTLILTHPVTGYFYRLDGLPGTYRVWHERIPLREATCKAAYFGIFETLGLLTRAEMQHPVSTLVCRRTQFSVLLPPRRVCYSPRAEHAHLIRPLFYLRRHPMPPSKVKGTKEDPWQLKTPPGTSDYSMYRDEASTPPTLVCKVGTTTLLYDLRCIDELHAMLKKHGDWMDLGSADEQKPAKDGTVEAWGRSPDNPRGGWYGLKKGLRGRFGMYLPPLMEALGLVELEHNAKNNRMRAK